MLVGTPRFARSAKEAKPPQDNGNQESPASEDTKYLDHLFSFLDGKELNYTSTGYFAKIVANFLQKNASDV